MHVIKIIVHKVCFLYVVFYFLPLYHYCINYEINSMETIYIIYNETTLHESKRVCDYLSMYETLLPRNVVPFATGQCN